MIALTPKRTKLMLRIRRLLTAKQISNKPKWPLEAVEQVVNKDMAEIRKLPLRKVRLVAAALAEGNV